jgi:hypothetical protein
MLWFCGVRNVPGSGTSAWDRHCGRQIAPDAIRIAPSLHAHRFIPRSLLKSTDHKAKWLCYLEGNVLVRDFRAAGGLAAAVGVFGGRGCVRLDVVGAGASAACAGCGGIAAATQHAEITRDNFKTGALLAFFVLPFARLDAPFDKD